MLIDAPNLADLIPDDEVEIFQRDGVICVRQALTSDWLTVLEDGIERALRDIPMVRRGASSQQLDAASRSRNGGGISSRPAIAEQGVAFEAYGDGSGEYYDAKGLWQDVPEFQAFVFDSPIVDIVCRLLSSESAWLFYDQLLVKNGGNARPTRFHQDSTFFPCAGIQAASAWIVLESLPREQALECVKGSHKGPTYAPPKGVYATPDGNAVRSPLLPMPDIESNRNDYDIVSWSIEPGDVVFLNFNTIHGGAPTANSRRRAYSLRIIGEDVVYRDSGVEQLDFPGLGASLRDGDPLRHGLFPKVRPRALRPA